MPAGRVASVLKPNRAADGKRKSGSAAITADGVARLPEGRGAGDTSRDTPAARRYQCAGRAGRRENQEVVMKRIVIAAVGTFAVAAAGASIAPAASPQVNLAIKAVQAVGSDPAKLKLFCEFHKLLQSTGEKEDEAVQKQIEDLVVKIGPDFSAAWDIADELDENSADGQEFYDAVDTLAEKCQ
jgi:hypothetical protein